MNLKEFRQQYPEYDDMSDEVLVDKMHKKFYSDIPLDQFYAKLEYVPAQQESLLQGFMKGAPQQALQFTLGAGDSVQNLLANTANVLPGVNLPLAQTGQGGAYDVGQIAGDVAGFAGGGSALNAARLGAKAIPYVGRAAEALGGEGLAGIARRGLGSAAYGAIQAPENRLEGGGEAAAISAAIDSMLGVAGKFKPSNLLRGSLSPEELARNLEVTRGTNTDLGSVVGSPGLKKFYENILQNVPLSGVEKTMQKTAGQVTERGETLLKDILGGASKENIKGTLHDSLISAHKVAREEEKNLYNQTDELAKALGVNIGRQNFSKAAKEELEEVMGSPELKDELPKGILKSLQNYASNIEGNNLKRSNVFRSKLGEKATKYSVEGERHVAGIYGRLKDAITKDMDDAMSASGSPELRRSYDEAQEYYKTNVVPFLSDEVAKYVRPGADTDLILNTFLKTGKNDRSILLEKLMSKLPKEQKGLPAYDYLSPALQENQLNPQKMKTLYKSIGPNQRESLIKDKSLKQSLDDYMKLVEMNAEPLSVMDNRKTGARNTQALAAILAGGISGSFTGNAIPGALVPVILGGTSSLVNKGFITNESYRNKLVEALMKPNSSSAIGNLIRNVAKPLSFQAWE